MDQLTFQHTVFIHKDKLYRLAKRMLIDEQEAQDLVQNVMMKLWQQRDQLHKYNNIEGVAMRSVKNEVYNRMQHQKVIATHQTWSRQTNEHLQPRESNTHEIILSLIEELPPKQRMVMHLRDVEEYEFEEIASITEMDEAAIRMNLMRARQKIRTQLEKIFEYEQRNFKETPA